MKLKLNRENLLKAIVLVILVIAIALGAVELLFLIDLGGLDFAVTFLLVYFAAIRDAILFKYRMFKSELGGAIVFLSSLYMFRPKILISHASASGVIVALTCSMFLACLMWVPVMILSSGFMG